MGIANSRLRLTIGGLRIVIRRMSINLGVFKRYGVVVIQRGLRRKRRGTRVIIDNYYYGNEFGTLALVGRGRTDRTGKRRTSLSAYKVFGNTTSPTDDFTVIGVVSSIRIIRGSDDEHIVTTAGTVDPSFEPERPIP